MISHSSTTKILVTGATGYVGGALAAVLVARGLAVRCFARNVARTSGLPFASAVEWAEGDVTDEAALVMALTGIEVAYYLVHSMADSAEFAERDRDAARIFGRAAARAGVRRIIYLGGLGDENEELSEHLRSRHETGSCLRASGVEVVEFRASIVLGSGSISFEMIRNLVERLPVMITPRWVEVETQPIAIRDLISYLVAALTLPSGDHRIYEIGGADVVTYGSLMREYARQRGLRRLLIRVPVLTPRLSSLWVALVTPLYARVGRRLIESIRHPTIVRDRRASTEFAVRPMGVRDAVAETLAADDATLARFRAGSGDVPRFGFEVDRREITVHETPATAFAPIRRIGGRNGWYAYNALWQIRGGIDRLLGGVGMRRGRRDPEQLAIGESLDFWRVEDVREDRRLLLAAEMKLPGRAWLEFDVAPIAGGAVGSRVRQTAIFQPHGALGFLYWFLILPLHRLIFAAMLARIGELAREHRSSPWSPAEEARQVADAEAARKLRSATVSAAERDA